MEEKRICSKIMAGGVEYVVNFDERYLRLAADFPRKGDKGSWHDEKTKVSLMPSIWFWTVKALLKRWILLIFFSKIRPTTVL